jgi:hypothetical protein
MVVALDLYGGGTRVDPFQPGTKRRNQAPTAGESAVEMEGAVKAVTGWMPSFASRQRR